MGTEVQHSNGELPLSSSRHNSTLQLRMAALFGMLAVSFVGCHRRGVTDLYVDSMASEIRDLQDQLYEYDHEYRLLEQELESLRRQNTINRQPGNPAGGRPELLPSTPLEFSLRNELPKPGRAGSPAPGNGSIESTPRSTEELSSPALPSIIDQPEGLRTAPQSLPEEIRSEPSNPPAFPASSPDDSTDFDFDPEGIEIPSISTTSIMPPRVGPRDPNTAPEADLEVGLSQIELPLQLASSADQRRGARVSEATAVPSDQNVVELAFHPILCRSVNFDDDEHEDGVFLVLQPKNRSGQFIPVAAKLTVEIIDPSRDTATDKIGYWSYSSSEIRDKIHPLGSQQGIHLTLPWNGPNPKADRIIVRATYSFENGRQIAAKRELFISGPGKLKTVWAPRAGSNYEHHQQALHHSHLSPQEGAHGDKVIPAGGTQSPPFGSPPAVTTGPFLAPEAAPIPKPL